MRIRSMFSQRSFRKISWAIQDATGALRETSLKPSKQINQPRRQHAKFVIEREIPGAGQIEPSRSQDISLKVMRGAQQSRAQRAMGTQLRNRRQNLLYLHAADESLVRRHAELGGSRQQDFTRDERHRSCHRRIALQHKQTTGRQP